MQISRDVDKIHIKLEENEKVNEVIIYTYCELKAYRINLDKMHRLHITIK